MSLLTFPRTKFFPGMARFPGFPVFRCCFQPIVFSCELPPSNILMRSISGSGRLNKKKQESQLKFLPLNPTGKLLAADKKFSSSEKRKGFLWLDRKTLLIVLFGGFLGFAAKVLPHSLLKNPKRSYLQRIEEDGSETTISEELVNEKLFNFLFFLGWALFGTFFSLFFKCKSSFANIPSIEPNNWFMWST